MARIMCCNNNNTIVSVFLSTRAVVSQRRRWTTTASAVELSEWVFGDLLRHVSFIIFRENRTTHYTSHESIITVIIIYRGGHAGI